MFKKKSPEETKYNYNFEIAFKGGQRVSFQDGDIGPVASEASRQETLQWLTRAMKTGTIEALDNTVVNGAEILWFYVGQVEK